MVSEGLEDMLASASKALKLNKFADIGLWVTAILGFGFPVFFLFTLAFLILKILCEQKAQLIWITALNRISKLLLTAE